MQHAKEVFGTLNPTNIFILQLMKWLLSGLVVVDSLLLTQPHVVQKGKPCSATC